MPQEKGAAGKEGGQAHDGRAQPTEDRAMTTTQLALPDLAQEIDREHAALISAAHAALRHAVRCGELLIQAKTSMAHGDWLGWLETNCQVRPRTAQAYMRLARELPKLPEANTRRVAHLTVRDALAAVSQNTAWIAALPESEQGDFIEAAETGTDRLVTLRQRHERAKNMAAMQLAQIAAPPLRAQPGRRQRLMKNGNEKRIMLVTGPNQAGLHLAKHLSELRAGDENRAKQAEVDDLRRAADDLERQAGALRDKAKRLADDLEAWSVAKLVEQHGPVEPFIETAEYAVDLATFDELAGLPEQSAITELLATGMAPVDRGYWGNMADLPFASLEPAVNWTGIGHEHGLPPEIVASIMPGSP
jgi:hypothetical protein